MQLKSLTIRLLMPLLQCILLPQCVANNRQQLTDVANLIKEINVMVKYQINILINFDQMLNNNKMFKEYTKASQLNEVPRLILTNQTQQIRPLCQRFSDESLTIAWITKENINVTLKAVDQLLWTIHFTDIFLIYYGLNEDFPEIFQLCWHYGFTSVLLWSEGVLVTYHPYPKVKVAPLQDVKQFQDKSHLNNFHQYEMVVPVEQYPPVSFSYVNRRGELLRVGYFHRWIEIFLNHHNASISYHHLEVWNGSSTLEDIRNALKEMKFSFVSLDLSDSENYASSIVLIVTKTLLIVPAGQEISRELYLRKPFGPDVWWIIVLCGLSFFLMQLIMNKYSHKQLDVSLAFLHAMQALIFEGMTFLHDNFLLNCHLCLLFLFTGLFLTSFYNTNLASMLTSKLYRPEPRFIEDLKPYNLPILEHSANYEDLMKLEVPEFIKKRVVADNNTNMKVQRQSLNMSNMYTGQEDLVDFLLFQQIYMKKPKAKKLKEALKYRPFFLNLPFRSPIINQFNRYLLNMRENGILEKTLRETNWHGILSGNLKIIQDDTFQKSLTIQYFYYALLVWFCGLLAAFIAFLIEYFDTAIMGLVKHLINKISKIKWNKK